MNFYLSILGSGAALPTGARHCSAQVLNLRGFKILLDCAEGTQNRIRQHHIKLQSISTIVISHLHGDHFFGLPGLLSTMHLCGRTEELTIIAPLGARKAIETLFELSGNHIAYPLRWVEISLEEGEQRVFENARCTIDAFGLRHSVPTYGYRFTQTDPVRPITYTYCCDTAYDPSLVPHLRGADLLCLECTFANEMESVAAQRFHLTAGQAASLAAQAEVPQLLLTHISARYREPELLSAQASEVFKNAILATDGMRLFLDELLPARDRKKTENEPSEEMV